MKVKQETQTNQEETALMSEFMILARKEPEKAIACYRGEFTDETKKFQDLIAKKGEFISIITAPEDQEMYEQGYQYAQQQQFQQQQQAQQQAQQQPAQE